MNPPNKRERTYLQRLAVGGLKAPRSSSELAIPASRNIKRTATGKIPKGRQPTTLRGKANVVRKRLRKSNPGLWQVMRNGRLRLLYTLVPRARVSKQFRFYEDAASTTNRAFPHQFDRALAKAIQTARF